MNAGTIVRIAATAALALLFAGQAGTALARTTFLTVLGFGTGSCGTPSTRGP